MAHRYIPCDRDQLFLLPTSMREWLSEDHLVWFVLDVVAKVDTSAFHARHPNDGVGRPAYDPEVLLALMVYAYSNKVRSSRRIEQLCETDVAYRVICANRVPDHATIARFRADHEEAIKALFVDVLVLCAAAGLTSLGTVAIDGTKVAASAALRANRSGETIRSEIERLRAQVAEIVGEAGRVDAAEDDRFGSARGDELPAELASPLSRLKRLERAMDELVVLEKEAATKTDEEAAKTALAAAQGNKRRGRKPSADPHKAVARAEADVMVARARMQAAKDARVAKAQQSASEGRKVKGPQPVFARLDFDLEDAEARLAAARAAAQTARPAKANPPRVNVTDPDSRIMLNGRGEWVQGYNAQAAVNEQQIVVGWGLTQCADDHAQLLPLMQATIDGLSAAGVRPEIGVFLADAGYWSEGNATAPGPDRLIATLKDWKQRRAARDKGTTNGPPPPGASPAEAMEHRLRTPDGAKTYAKRSYTVEPVFANTKANRGFARFMRRGLDAVTSEWSFMATTHNILKLYRSSLAAT